MKKAVMLSIQPKWCELIANGQKTIEVRKTRPSIKTPFKCYIYCTKVKGLEGIAYRRRPRIDGCYDMLPLCRGKVIGEFVCDYIEEFACDSRAYRKLSELGSCLTEQEIRDYCNGQDLYGWHISDLVIYDKPRELSEFYTYCRTYPVVKDCDVCIENCPKATKTSDWTCDRRKPLTRPPQSWKYVNGVCYEQA